MRRCQFFVHAAVAIGASCLLSTDVQDLGALIDEQRGERRPSHGVPEVIEWRRDWLTRFEEAWANADASHPMYYSAAAVAAEQYRLANQPEEAFSLYDVVMASNLGPDSRLATAEGAMRIAATHFLDPYLLETYADEYDAILSIVPPESTPSLFKKWLRAPALKADLTRALVSHAEAIGADNSTVSKARAAILLEQASEMYDAFVDRITGSPFVLTLHPNEQEALARESTIARWHAAQSLRQAASALTRSGAEERANRFHQRAADAYESYFASVPGPFPEQIVLEYFAEIQPLLSDKAFLTRAENFLTAHEFPPSHGVILFLRSGAVQLSNDDRTLATSNAFFDLIVRLERTWFPDEFEAHANYQLALIRSARNAVRMGDLEAAATRLEELEGIEIRSASLRDSLDHARRLYARYASNGYDLEADTSPSRFDDRIGEHSSADHREAASDPIRERQSTNSGDEGRSSDHVDADEKGPFDESADASPLFLLGGGAVVIGMVVTIGAWRKRAVGPDRR